MKPTRGRARSLPVLALGLGLALAVGCGGGRGAAPAKGPSAGAFDGGDIVLGTALPAGQLLQIGGPRFSHASSIDQLGFAAGGALVSAAEGHVRVWEPSGALRWQSFEVGSDASFAVSPDGALIAVAHARMFGGGRAAIHEVGGKLRQPLPLDSVEAMAFSPDGQRLVMAARELVVFDLEQQQRVAMLGQDALMVGFAGDDTVIAVSKDGVRRWSWRSNKAELVHAFPAPPSAVAMARDGETVAWAVGNAVSVLPLGLAATRSEVTAPGPVRSLALSPLGDAVAIGWEGGMGVWTTGEGGQQKWSLPSKIRLRAAMAFSSTGQTLIAAEWGRFSTFTADRGAYEQTAGEETTFYDFDASGDPLVSHRREVWRIALGSGARTPGGEAMADSPEWVTDFAHAAGGALTGWDSMATLDCKPLRMWMRAAGARTNERPAERAVARTSERTSERTIDPPRGCESDAGEVWFPGPGLSVAAGKPSEVWDVAAGKRLFTLPVRPARLVAASFSSDRRWLVMVHLTEPVEEERGHGYAGSVDGVDDDGDADDADDVLTDEERELKAAMEHEGDGYDPALEAHYLVEAIELSKPVARDAWEPARALAWYEKVSLDSVAILNDGTIFAGVEDARVVAAPPGVSDWSEVGQLLSRVFTAHPSPTGAAVAFTDEDSRTVLFSAESAKRAQGH